MKVLKEVINAFKTIFKAFKKMKPSKLKNKKIDKIQNFFNKVGKLFKQIIEFFEKKIKSIFRVTKRFVTSFFRRMRPFIAKFAKLFEGLFKKVFFGAFKLLIKALPKIIISTGAALGGFFTGGVSLAITAIEVGLLIKDVYDFSTEIVPELAELPSKLEDLKTTFIKGIDDFEKETNEVKEKFNSAKTVEDKFAVLRKFL